MTALTPAYPTCHIPIPTIDADPCAHAGDLQCPDCSRTFTQAGPWKRYMRSYHQIPCQIEDIFVIFRDTTSGFPTCAHCTKHFAYMYRLHDYINRRVCLQFNPAKDRIVPINDRPDLRMHLRHRSVPQSLRLVSDLHPGADHAWWETQARPKKRRIGDHFNHQGSAHKNARH